MHPYTIIPPHQGSFVQQIIWHCSNKNLIFQVSGYLKKQMTAVEGQDTDEIKNMLAEHDKLVEEIFQHEDKDKNGFISHEEFSGPKHDEL